jgi:acyl carrier protein
VTRAAQLSAEGGFLRFKTWKEGLRLPSINPSESEIIDWCISYIRDTLEVAATEVGPNITFAEMGLDSAASAYFVVELEEWLGIELYPEIVADYPTVAQLAHHIATRAGPGDGAVS